MSNKQAVGAVILCVLISANIQSQDFGFGFGIGDEETGGAGGIHNALNVTIGGEVSASMLGYIDDFSEGPDHVSLGDIFSGKLNFSAQTAIAEGLINIQLRPTLDTPVSIDEAYIRAFFGRFNLTAGLRKLTWGKADSFGPLDVINPLDYSRIFTEMADNISLMGVKIARPLVHASYRLGNFSRIEAVFVPWFMPHQFPPAENRWVDSRMAMLASQSITINTPIGPIVLPIAVTEPNTTTLDYAQAGIRYTTTLGSADIGAQYYYGRLPQPSAGITFNLPIPIPQVAIMYNPYHQVGVDYAQVVYGFNIRAELAANITEDLAGNDGSVYNPCIAWSFGFDRDIALGINVNFQITESIRLQHDKLGGADIMSAILGNFDIEGGQHPTSTRVSTSLSRTFFRDELELRTAVVWGIEDKDCLIMPALIWTRDALNIAFSGGFFAGTSNGQLGQYRDNHFLKIAMTYTF